MSELTELQKVNEETMRFIRGKYFLDEIGNGIDELKLNVSGQTVLTINIREDRYDFFFVFEKAERELFEVRRNEFSQRIQEIYHKSRTYDDGKVIIISVTDLQTLEAVKQLILIKMKPNRKPFPKEQAIYASSGHRCDLCVHYNGGTICNLELMNFLLCFIM